MNKIDLSQVRIEAPIIPEVDDLDDRIFEDYRVKGFIGVTEIGHLTICRALNPTGSSSDKFFLDMSKNPPEPKAYVHFQEVKEPYWGNSLCGRMIVLANEFYKDKIGNLYSSDHFIQPESQSKRVWEKLEEEGFADYKPHIIESGKKLDRWILL